MSPRSVLTLALVLALPAGAFAQKIDNEKIKIGERLAKKVSIDKPYEAKFGEAVKMLAEKFDLPLVVDPSVGTGGGAMAACDADDRVVKLPKLLNVRVDTVLKLVCDQVGAVALTQPDHIKITDAVWGLYETGVLAITDPTNPGGDDSPLLATADLQKAKPLIKRALVTGAYKNVPLGEIIDDIAESTGATVVVSPAVGEAAKKTLTVRFSNTPVDAAVRTLCEMAELGVVEDANVVLVTTEGRAAERAKEITDKRKARLAEVGGGLGGGLVGLGGGGAGLFASPEAAEIVKLKEQHDAMKKQIEELQKAVKK